MESLLFLICMALAVGLCASTAMAAIPAFPGAEGYGKWAQGGRGGRALFVTNLNDAGPGSFRAACEAEGPRMVIFRTGGTITLKTPLTIANPYLTIAGQTAPGGGICITTEHWRGDKSALSIRTDDAVLRYLRIRTAPPPPPGPGDDRYSYAWIDPISLWGKETCNIMLDHISASWGSKDAIRSWAGPRDVTIQHCIMSEGITPSLHSKGALAAGGSDRFTFYRNLFAHNQGRNPYIKGKDENGTGTVATFQVTNNVIYDWEYYAMEVGVDDSLFWSPTPGDTRANLVGNYFKGGPSTDPRRHEVVVGKQGTVRLYLADNIGPHRPGGSGDEWEIVGLRWLSLDKEAPAGIPAPKMPYQANEPFDLETLPRAVSAQTAYEEVLRDVGATKPMRDAVDKRVITQVRNGTGRIIADPSEVGGWPALEAGQPYPDEDGDGMDDRWELAQFGSLDNDGRADSVGDGYTDLERFLETLV